MGLSHRLFFFLELLLDCLVDLLGQDALCSRHELATCSHERSGYWSKLLAEFIAQFLDVVESRCDIRHDECCVRHRFLKFVRTDGFNATSKMLSCIKCILLLGRGRFTTTAFLYTFIPVYIGEVKRDIINGTKIKIVSVDLTIRSSLPINFISHG